MKFRSLIGDGIIDYFKDAKITAQLRFQMLRDRDVSDINFSVETVNGIVLPHGNRAHRVGA